MSKYDTILDTDVLVIGGGFSGTWAALKAREHVRNVLMVDKGPRDWGGLGSMSGGDMIVKQPEFEASDLVDELTYYYDGLCEQDVLEEILNLSHDRFMDLERMGHRFHREGGELQSVPQRGLEKMRYYFYHPYGKGGAHTTEVLNKRLRGDLSDRKEVGKAVAALQRRGFRWDDIRRALDAYGARMEDEYE